jgi:hypothetical protein
VIAFTSLLVRIAVGDNRERKGAALALAEQHRDLISKTVVLEAEWLLRSRYGLRPTEILGFLSFLWEKRPRQGPQEHAGPDPDHARWPAGRRPSLAGERFGTGAS